MQECSKCGISKAKSEFYKHQTNKSGLSNTCKSCISEYSKRPEIRARANMNRRLARSTPKGKEKRKLERKKYNRKRKKYNPSEKDLEKGRIYQANRYATPEGKLAKRLYEQSPAGKAASIRKRIKRQNLKKNNGIFTITDSFLRHLYSSNCAFCGSNKNIEMDHIVPLSKGGRHAEGNLQPLCRSCNASKANKFMSEWRYKRIPRRVER